MRRGSGRGEADHAAATDSCASQGRLADDVRAGFDYHE